MNQPHCFRSGYIARVDLVSREITPLSSAMRSAVKSLGVVLLLLSSTAAQATTLPQCALGCANAAAAKAMCDLYAPCLLRISRIC
jgi:hypothetical protein